MFSQHRTNNASCTSDSPYPGQGARGGGEHQSCGGPWSSLHHCPGGGVVQVMHHDYSDDYRSGSGDAS